LKIVQWGSNNEIEVVGSGGWSAC